MTLSQAQHRAINCMDRTTVVGILENYCFQCYEHETTSELRDALRSNLEDRTIDTCVLDT
ncbi:hypothetical protein BSFA1_80600 (plasmid) [Burkholderia sp. SFA1]|uniref:Uncharacterized protein n=1 Tax=Burkholderia vietnamiensis (strain G4 / LMG 22486) TaxID=269482 RepID=A4JU78_BURVG|nr:hypothetical protein Bcep1808_6944 [Burkholderia vietnamiensis G4]AET95317.1 hypothetical protein BYI23_E001560 [Burkholderia sp. YI23]MCB4350008.1 hypothetical protein [Burkholderia vietnamiensis]BBQ02932.1 hypothetical protein BSFA1_80600 [Burkholderia sp. SFA1]